MPQHCSGQLTIPKPHLATVTRYDARQRLSYLPQLQVSKVARASKQRLLCRHAEDDALPQSRCDHRYAAR